MTIHLADDRHGPGVLVIERRGVSLIDLERGEPRTLSTTELGSLWSRPELTPARTELPEPMRAVPASNSMAFDATQRFVVHEPVLVRLDAGRFLAWDESMSCHVELGLEHIQLLDQLRVPLGFDRVHAASPEGADRLGQLLALSLVRTTDEPEPPVPGQELRDPLEHVSDSPEHADDAVDQPGEPDGAPEPAELDAGGVDPGASADEPAQETPDDARPGADQSVEGERLMPFFADLPAGPLAKLHVLAYRVVGRTRRRLTGQMPKSRPTGAPVPLPVPSAPPQDIATSLQTPTGLEPRSEPTQEPAEEAAEVPADAAHAVEDQPSAPASEPTVPIPEPRLQSEPAEGDDRVPVIPLYCWGTVSDDQGYGEMVEPSLSVGVLFATARQHDAGRLLETYDLRRIRPDAHAVLEEWERNPRPAVFVFSDYLWNVEVHLELSARVKAASPDSICLHGGPSVPKYEEDSKRFFAENPSVDVTAHGEGEVTFVEILDCLTGELGPGALDRLSETAGITFRRPLEDGTHELVKTGDRERIAELNDHPSPYLTGEFDDLLSVEWRSASIETNRGCPYGCTFCDWGSATLSRIRKIDLDRVKAELDWIVTRAAPSELHVTDANFGIFARDVEIAEHVADLRRRFGSPYALTISLAKNTVKYSQRIIKILVDADVSPITASAAVQTMDPDTLVAIDRQNIKLEKYDELAVTFSEQGIPLVTDLLMGLPGSTLESFKNDLQHCFDREVTPRTMEIIMLPNSPMNEPGYREQYALEVNEHDVLVASSTYTREDYRKMQQLRLLYRASDHFGLLRHALRFVQWEHGLRAIDVLSDMNDAVDARGDRYPLLAFVARTFDLYTVPPVSWSAFYDEFAAFLQQTYDIPLGSDLRAVLDLQEALMPVRGRVYPYEVQLDHDVEAYRSDRVAAKRELAIRRPLHRYPPAVVVVTDPGEIADRNIKRNEFPGRRSATTGNLFWVGYDWELDSTFVRHLATNVGRFEREPV